MSDQQLLDTLDKARKGVAEQFRLSAEMYGFTNGEQLEDKVYLYLKNLVSKKQFKVWVKVNFIKPSTQHTKAGQWARLISFNVNKEKEEILTLPLLRQGVNIPEEATEVPPKPKPKPFNGTEVLTVGEDRCEEDLFQRVRSCRSDMIDAWDRRDLVTFSRKYGLLMELTENWVTHLDGVATHLGEQQRRIEEARVLRESHR